MTLGENYVYSSMLYSKIDTNKWYLLVDRNKNLFQSILQKITGKRQAIVLYGNCQTHAMVNLLSSNQEFKQRYVIYTMPRLWIDEDKEKFALLTESGLFSHVDYFFTQQVRGENRFGYMASTEYMISQLSDCCKVITISNLYFKGYFPQYFSMFHGDTEKMSVNFLEGKILNSVRYIDHEILKLIVQGYSNEEIIDRISASDYFKAEELTTEIERELEQFALREENVEIKMCDWIKSHYNIALLFATANHPTREALFEFSRRILHSLNVKDSGFACEEDEILSPMPKDIKFILYPSVLKAFGLPEQKYNLHVKFRGCELPVLRDIDEELEQFIEKGLQNPEGLFDIQVELDFIKYMKVYIKILQSLLHI